MFRELKTIAGETLSERNQGSKRVLVGNTLATVKALKVGQTITIADEKFHIGGIFESSDDLENGMVVMLLDDAQKVLGKKDMITGCTVKIKDKSSEGIAAVRAEIEGPIAEKCGLKGKVRARIAAEFYAGLEAGRDFRYPPVERVSWYDAQEFCRRLSALPAERMAGRRYRLPTEAEWEYAARADAGGGLDAADENRDSSDAAWYLENSHGRPHPVGQKAHNAWGLCDMYGNVGEWCADGYAADYYAQSPIDDPAGPSTADVRVIRGGSWKHPASACRAAARFWAKPDERSSNVGFRVLLETKSGPEGPR